MSHCYYVEPPPYGGKDSPDICRREATHYLTAEHPGQGRRVILSTCPAHLKDAREYAADLGHKEVEVKGY